MISRFDHCIIALQNLESSSQHLGEALGLSIYPGGRHSGLGTENSIARFGLDYLEFLGIYDRAEVLAAGIKRASLLDFLAEREGGLLAYCLAVTDIEGLAEQFRSTGLEALGPYSMERLRPDGLLLRWRLLVPGGTAWRKVWPFFIEWEMPDDERLRFEQPGVHAIGAQGVSSVSVLVDEMDPVLDMYSRQLGLKLEQVGGVAHLNAKRATYRIGEFSIHLFCPTGTGPLRQAIDSDGTGLYQIEIAVDDMMSACGYLKAHDCICTPDPLEGGVMLIPKRCANGARIALTAKAAQESPGRGIEEE